MLIFKKIVFIIFTLVFALIVIIILFFIYMHFSVSKVRAEKSEMIERICSIKNNTSFEEVVSYAKNIGFDFNNKSEFGIPSEVEIVDDDKENSVIDNKSKKFQIEDYQKFQNGYINFGKSLFLFERKGCKVFLKNRKVVRTEKWYLD